jgi:hypothetical protein
MFWDPGSLDALGRILRTWVETEGDAWELLKTTGLELGYAVPVFGQALLAVTGGAEASLIMIIAKLPYIGAPTGYLLICYTLAESGFAIYDVEYVKPVRNNLEDAVYRGFIGPDTRWYEKAPPWTQADEEERKRLGRLREKTIQYIRAPTTRRLYLIRRVNDIETELAALAPKEDERRRALQLELKIWKSELDEAVSMEKEIKKDPDKRDELRDQLAEIDSVIAALDGKEAMWLDFERNWKRMDWMGGFWTNEGAQAEQIPFTPYLLEDVPFLYLFAPSGVVDFRTKKLTREEEKVLKRLQEWLIGVSKEKIKIPLADDADPNDKATIETFLRNLKRHDELAAQKAQFEQARRYRLRAGEQSDKDR